MEKIKKYPEEVALAFILFIGAVLRFNHLGFSSLSNDELSAITRAQYNSFSDMIQHGVMIDFHPAGVETFMYFWMKIFGDGVFIVRFPFAVAGILSILMLYLVAERWFNKTTALFAAAALSFLQFPVLYSQLARPYAFGLFFILTATYFWTAILFPRAGDQQTRKKIRWLHAGFILSMSACTHTHYFAFMLAGIIGLSGFFFLRKENIKSYVISGIVILCLFIPELPVFTHQMSIGGLGGWLGKPDGNFFRTFLNYCFNDSNFIFYLCFGIFVASFVYFRKRIEITRFHWLALTWFLMPFIIGYYYSVLRNPVLQYSTLLFGFPFLLMLIFSFLPADASQKRIVIAAAILFTLIGSFHTVKVKHYYWTNHFGVFKELAQNTIKWSDKYGDDKMTKVISVINPNYIDYYFQKLGHKMKIDLYKTESDSDLANLMNLVNKSSSTYFLYGWSNIWHPHEAVQIIMNKYPTVVERDTFFNSEITLFKRDVNAAAPKVIPPFTDFENNLWAEETTIRTDELAHSGKYSQKMDDKTEYSINYTKRLIDLISIENGMVTASVWVNVKDADNDARLVLSFESGGKSFEWYASEIKAYNLHPGEWQQVIISRPLPKMKAIDDMMKVYIWNPGKKIFYVDDFEVKVEQVVNR